MARTAEYLIRTLASASLSLAAAESCTGGLVSDLLVRVPGASRVLWGSFICYSIDAKWRMLGIGEDLILRFGAVSRETACAMAQGALEKSGADAAVSVTGLAGPRGGGPELPPEELPPGTVWIATALRGEGAEASLFHYSGSRNRVRRAAARDALRLLADRIRTTLDMKG